MKLHNLNRILTIVSLVLVNCSIAFSAQGYSLNFTERATLRTRLESLFNEVDLLVKNQKVDRADLKKQERNLTTLKVYERIPLQPDVAGLKKSLEESSVAYHVRLIRFQVFSRDQKPKTPPRKVFTDAPEFHFSEDQLVELIPFKAIVAGSADGVQQWIQSWPTQQLRLIESKSIKMLKNDRWEVLANGFRFRNVKFPTLQPRAPKELLPDWARKNPKLFSESEPLLWSFVTRIESLAPKSGPFYRTREQFLLNDARMNFFLSKALKP